MRFRKAEKPAGERGVKEGGGMEKKEKNLFYHLPAAETISIIHRRTHVCFSFIFLSLSGRRVQDAFYLPSVIRSIGKHAKIPPQTSRRS